MADLAVVDMIIEERPDYIVHAAAITDVDYSVREPRRTLEKNIRGEIHAFEAARNLPNLRKFIYVSTDEVYGECDHLMLENEMLAPRNPYSCAKAAGSLMRITYDNTYATLQGKTAETRFCNVFGPRQDTRKIMPIIKRALDEGVPVPVFDQGTSYREYIHVANIPPAIELIFEKGVGVYNVTNNDGYTVKDLIKKTEAVTERTIPVTVSHRPGIDMRYQMDSSRIRALGWSPLLTFDEGLRSYLTSRA